MSKKMKVNFHEIPQSHSIKDLAKRVPPPKKYELAFLMHLLKMKIKILFTLPVFFMVASFALKEKSIIGLYGECPQRYWVCQQLELKKDSTFEYFTFYDVGGGIIQDGTWKVDGDTLILNTYDQPKAAVGYTILDSTYRDTTEIYCFYWDSLTFAFGTAIINFSDTIRLDIDGYAKYKGEIKNIEFQGLFLENSRFALNPKSGSALEFIVESSYSCCCPYYLINEKLVIDGNEIKPYYHCHHKFADSGLKKTRMKNKRF